MKQVVSNNTQGAWVLGIDADVLTLDTIQRALSSEPMDVPEAWQQSAIGRTLSGIYFRIGRKQQDLLKSINIRNLMEKEQKEIHDEEEVIAS